MNAPLWNSISSEKWVNEMSKLIVCGIVVFALFFALPASAESCMNLFEQCRGFAATSTNGSHVCSDALKHCLETGWFQTHRISRQVSERCLTRAAAADLLRRFPEKRLAGIVATACAP
jgi:hypothetical protein